MIPVRFDPALYPRRLFGVSFRWPSAREAAVVLALLGVGLAGAMHLHPWFILLPALACCLLLFRMGVLINPGKPLRGFAVAGVFMVAMNLLLVAGVLVVAWLAG